MSEKHPVLWFIGRTLLVILLLILLLAGMAIIMFFIIRNVPTMTDGSLADTIMMGVVLIILRLAVPYIFKICGFQVGNHHRNKYR